MHYGTIKPYDIANGTGVRVSLFGTLIMDSLLQKQHTDPS